MIPDEILDLAERSIVFPGGLVIQKRAITRIRSADACSWKLALLTTRIPPVPAADRGRLLSFLAERTDIDLANLPDSLRPAVVVQSEPAPRLRVLSLSDLDARYRQRTNLAASIHFAYGDLLVDAREASSRVYDPMADRWLARDTDSEARCIQQLATLPLRQATGGRERRDDACCQFPRSLLPDIVSRLLALGWTVEAEGRSMRPGGVTTSLRVSTGTDWFDIRAHVSFDDQDVPLPEILRAVRAADGFVKLGDGTYGMLPEKWLATYSRFFDLGEVDGDLLRFRPSQALLIDALLAAQDHHESDARFRGFCQKLRGFSGVRPKDAPKTFRGTLRDYQKLGLGWMAALQGLGLGGCLADDMGLGKTVQVLSLLEGRRTRRLKQGEPRLPSLIVVPKSLIFNWLDEAARFTPRLRAASFHGTGRTELLEQIKAGGFDVVVTTYGTVIKDISRLAEIEFDYGILDEAQAIRNPESQSSKACRLLRVRHRLALTGTPIENHLGDLWSLFEFLNPGLLGRSAAFQRFSKAAGTGAADSASLDALAAGLRPYLLRRTKEQVLTELPKKTEQTLFCEMEAKQRRAYTELRDFYRKSLERRVKAEGMGKAKIHVLEALLRLRQAACHPGLIDPGRQKEPSAKIDTLLEQLDDVLAERHKVLVFSQFTTLLGIVRERLKKRGIAYEYLDGKTANRKAAVTRFQADSGCPIFLISLKAGGHGLNLTAADYVFILDPWWNPAAEAQAIDRAHRMGQGKPVFAYRLICRETIEERILVLQKSKRELADAIVSASDSVIRNLTAEDLQLLLS